MAEEYRATRRPTRTQDLLQRLKSGDSTEKEKAALYELCRCMVKIFSNDPKPIYVAEATAFAPVLQRENQEKLLIDLITALGNAIIKGTADGNIEEPSLYKAFAYVLWHTKDTPAIRPILSSVLRSLLTRLRQATIIADLHTQYLIVCSMSAILDSMVDIRLSGLSRESFHEPLLKQLKDLTKDEDMRLAQVSSYAYQAALGIKDDEGPLEALWRYTMTTVQSGADIAGAVSGMDPGALLRSLPSVSSIIDLVQKLIDIGENVADIMKNINDAREHIDSTHKISKQKGWYKALRYIELLLQSEAWSALKSFVEQAPCRKEIRFQSGLYSEIEKAWKIADLVDNVSRKDKIMALYHELSKILASTEPIVQAWTGIVGITMGISVADPVKVSRRPWSRKAKSCLTNLEPFFRWPSLVPNDSALLRDTWSNADSLIPKVLYTDLSIQEYYKLSKRLHIERLSGQLLPMDKCYINLEIEDKGAIAKAEHESTLFSLEMRLKLPPVYKLMSHVDQLQNLFEQRQQEGKMVEPRRIFIQGRAGIGKSTLCKKIVFEWLNGTVGNGKFDRLLWLPLRKLQSVADENRIWQRLLDDVLSRLGSDSEILVEAFVNQLDEDQTFRKRTLFLLDGLDEVALRWPEGSPMHRFLMNLVGMPSVIVTSRPQTKTLDIGGFDLELETVGFLPSQVQEYLQYCVEDKSTIVKINNFLGTRPSVQDLMRIPIQLDAFCHIWHSDLTREPNTITMLYHSICTELGKKDVVRLEKTQELHSNNINLLGSFEVKDVLQHEERYLENFAFQGLHSNVIEFSLRHQEIIAEHLHRQMVRLNGPFKIVLEKLSFLRSSGLDKDLQHQHVHFLHLTFQEFFAARFFVYHWQHDIQISCLKLEPMIDADEIKPKAFLQREKYNPRYHMFWRFVTGLIQMEGISNAHDNGLQAFFDTLESPPRDLFSCSHHRLLMYALSEIAPSNDKIAIALQEKISRQLYRWTLFELQAFHNGYNTLLDVFYGTRYLAHEREFPEGVLCELLNDTNKQARGVAVVLIISKKRPYLNLLWKPLVDLLADPNQDHIILRHTLIAMEANRSYWPEEVVYALLPLLGHSDETISHSTAKILATAQKLPLEATDTLLSIIKLNSHLHIESVYCLGSFLYCLPPLPQHSLIELISQTYNRDEKRSRFAGHVLQSLCWPRQGSSGILQALILLMDHENYWTRLGAISFMRHCVLTEEAQYSLCRLLKHSDSCIQEAACLALCPWWRDHAQQWLSKDSNDFLIELMTEPDTSTRVLAAKVFSSQKVLSESGLTVLHTLVKQEDEELRKSILPILPWQTNLPVDMIRTVLTIMATGDEENFEACTKLIRSQDCLRGDIAIAVGQWLESSSPRLRTAAATACIGAVGGWLPENILAQLIKILLDEQDNTHPKSSTTPVNACESRLYPDDIPHYSAIDERYDARVPTIEALRGKYQIPQLVYACMQWLFDENPRLYKLSTEVISSEIYNSPKTWPIVLNSLTQCPHPQHLDGTEIEDCNQIIRTMMETANTSSAELMSELVPIAIELLNQPWKMVQKIGARILKRASDLSLQMIETVTDIWSRKVHNPREIRWKKSVFGLHRWYVNVMELQNAFPRRTISSLVLLFTRECMYETSLHSEVEAHDISKRAWMLHSIARILIHQMSQGNLENSIVVELIKMSSLNTRMLVLSRLVSQNAEHELVSSFNNEILEALCNVYLRHASVAEVCCYHRPDGLYIRKGHEEMKLNLNLEQQDSFIRFLARVKSRCGLDESLEVKLSELTLDELND